MKKRNILTLMLVGVLVFVLGLGTMALYRKTFSSGKNPVRAARFEVDSNGTLDQDVEFNLSEEPIYPGYNNEDVYEFEIDKKGTEVPVKYNIKVTADGELFGAVAKGNSPVVMTLYRKTESGWVPVENEFEINPVEKGVENFKIGLKWNDSDYDIEYQNKSGKIAINVVAEQVTGKPEEPSIVSLVGPDPITVKVGDPVTMPSTVVANMSDGTTRDVPVTWEPAAIDTSTAGTKTAIGTVEGYGGSVTFTVTVIETAEPRIVSVEYRNNTPDKGIIRIRFANVPKDAYYYKYYYTVNGSSRGFYGHIQDDAWYSMDAKENVDGGKINVDLVDQARKVTYCTFTDIPLPNPSN